MTAIKVLIVDDSATMRAMIAAVLRCDSEILVVGEAADPLEARQAIKSLNPDVVTLDVEMPNMNGIDFLEKIMRLRPTPVIMLSTLTTRTAETTLRALEIGAFDCIAKPSPGNENSLSELPAKIKLAYRSHRRKVTASPRDRSGLGSPIANYDWDGRLVAIGASTGGVEALIEVISKFPSNCPATVITQHMPPTFTASFAQRLNRLCAADVKEATDGAALRCGSVYLAPGGDSHLEIVGRNGPVCRLRSADKINGHRPSVDALFHSVAKLGAAAVGIILTGMGSDGAQGLLAMRQAGAQTFGQDEQSCVVYGMPKVAFERGAVKVQLPLNRIASEVMRATSKTKIDGRS